MKKNRWVLRMVVLLVISGVMSMTVSLAAEAGSSQDPLVTMSYLNETFWATFCKRWTRRSPPGTPMLTGQSGGTSSAVFQVVTLSSGQTLTGDIGCEVMLRVGTATCVSPSTRD